MKAPEMNFFNWELIRPIVDLTKAIRLFLVSSNFDASHDSRTSCSDICIQSLKSGLRSPNDYEILLVSILQVLRKQNTHICMTAYGVLGLLIMGASTSNESFKESLYGTR